MTWLWTLGKALLVPISLAGSIAVGSHVYPCVKARMTAPQDDGERSRVRVPHTAPAPSHIAVVAVTGTSLALFNNPWLLAASFIAALIGRRLTCVGLTGGIGAGKSTVSDELRKQGAVIIDADEVARNVVQKGRPAFQRLVARYGDEIVDPATGQLNRKHLRSIMVNSASDRRFINSVTHPAIAQEILSNLVRYRWLQGKRVVLDAALLYEAGYFLRLLCAPIICVIADDDLRVSRVVARDNVTEESARLVLQAQMSQEKKASMSDLVIVNDGTPEATRERVRSLLAVI
jgi:dephospho-CoA kinase